MSTWKGVIGTKFSPEGFATYCETVQMTDDFAPEFVVVHNTQEPTLKAWHDVTGEERMRSLARYYRVDQQWSAGPHLFIADDGIWVFTPLTVSGVHSPSWNHCAWGMELVGDYDHEPFGDDVKSNALSALATLHTLAGWTSAQIRLHKEDPKTDHTFCPGVHVVKAELEAGIQTLLDLDR